MKTFKKMFQNNLFIRYLITFVGIILIISCLLIIEKTIPNNRVKANIIKSEDYYQEYFNDLYGDLDVFKNRHTMVDAYGDLCHLGILYLEDNKHPYKSFIEMNKDSQLLLKITTGGHFSDIEFDSDYSRYWHGHLLILKPLLTFFTMNTIYIIYFIVLLITFLILLLSILKHSKLLGVIMTLGISSINLFMVSRCDNFFYVMMITMISSIIIVKMYEEKSKNVDLLFLINGILSCCFDMLSGGTLAVTIPLFIYIYLHILDGKKIKFSLFIRYIFLWLFGFMFAFIMKWILLVIHYHGGFREHVLEPMKVRIGSGDQGRFSVFFDSINGVLHYIFPYDLYIIKYLFIGLGMISFFYLLKEKRTRKNYIYLLLICLIPFIRYFLLAEHSNYHNYFTYRAFLPNIMFTLLFICLAFINIKERILKRNKKKASI